jgi:hypothetical protein
MARLDGAENQFLTVIHFMDHSARGELGERDQLGDLGNVEG